MKSIVIYYSLTEKTEHIAQKIQQQTHADVVKLELAFGPCKTGYFRLLVIAKDVFLKKKPRLLTPALDLSSYDHIFIGSPIWMGTMAPALRTFMASHNFMDKMVIPFCTCEDQPDRFFDDLRKTNSLAKFSFGMSFKTSAEVTTEMIDEKVRVWLNNLTT